MGQQGGRTFEKNDRKFKFWAKSSYFFNVTRIFLNIFQKMLKIAIFWCQGGGKMNFFSNPHIGWSENGLREGDLLEGKSAYGYPLPLPTYGHSPTIPFSSSSFLFGGCHFEAWAARPSGDSRICKRRERERERKENWIGNCSK